MLCLVALLATAIPAAPQQTSAALPVLQIKLPPDVPERGGGSFEIPLFPLYRSADVAPGDAPQPPAESSGTLARTSSDPSELIRRGGKLSFVDFESGTADRPRPKLTFAALQLSEPDPSARRITARAFPNWTRAMRMHGSAMSVLERDCPPGAEGSCPLAGWRAFLRSIEGKDAKAQIILVNDFVNRFRYRSDSRNWDKLDYWAPPAEFFSVGGDCEDFAIAKFFSLKLLGFSPEDMRIVVLQDKRRRTNHAVLTLEIDGETLMLDSIDPDIVPWKEARHYRPFFSVNEQHYWLHTS